MRRTGWTPQSRTTTSGSAPARRSTWRGGRVAKPSRRRRHRGPPAQVRGFFADTESSWPFQFGSAAAARRSLGSHNVDEDEPEPKRARSSVSSADVRLAKEIGCVRVQFCKVVKWMKPLRHAATPRRASLPGSAAELCDRKGARVVAKAGTATVKDQEAATVEKEAVLSEKILHECRVFFNDFGACLCGINRCVGCVERAVK